MPLTAQLTNSFGDQFSSKLDKDCVEVFIRQHPKLPNKIEIAIFDIDGQWIGGVTTHDLANRKIEISLKGMNGIAVVAPSGKCKSAKM